MAETNTNFWIGVADEQLRDAPPYELTDNLLRQIKPVDALGVAPVVAVGFGGVARAIESGFTGYPEDAKDQPYELEGDTLVSYPTSDRPVVAGATYVARWDTTREAAVFRIERTVDLEDMTFEEPFGAVALESLEQRKFVKVPDVDEHIYSSYPQPLGKIRYALTEGTTVSGFSFVTEEVSDTQPNALITLSGPLRVEDPWIYLKVEDDRILHTQKPDENNEVEVTFPEDLTTFQLRVPEDCIVAEVRDGRLIALRANSGQYLDQGYSLQELMKMAATAHPEADEDKALELDFGITLLDVEDRFLLGLPPLDERGHAAIANQLGWRDYNDEFIENNEFAIRDILMAANARKITDQGRALIAAAIEDKEHPTEASEVGVRNVVGFLRDHLVEQQRAA